MRQPRSCEHVAGLIDPRTVERLYVMGPEIQMIALPEADEAAPCVMRGVIPPGVVVPLHSHPEPETFFHVAGELDGLAETANGYEWTTIREGDLFHVPGGARHAFRNRSAAAAVSIVVTMPSMGWFFREIGEPVGAGAHPGGAPSPDAVRRFLEASARRGYWNAGPDENARVGLSPPPLA